MSTTKIQEVFLGKPVSEFSRRNGISDVGGGARTWDGGTEHDQFLPVFPSLPALFSFPLSLLTIVPVALQIRITPNVHFLGECHAGPWASPTGEG